MVVYKIDILFTFRVTTPCTPFCFLFLFQLFFFDLVGDDVSSGPGETCRNWCGATVFGFAWLTCADRFVLILDDLMEGIPEVRDGFVLCGH